MHIVLGRPIELPQRTDPSAEEVQAALQRFITELQGLFERHKAAAGHPHATLTVV